MKEKNIKHDIVALHRGTQSDDAFIEEKKVNYKNNQFIYYFIGYTDNIMHSYGENDTRPQEYFSRVDKFIKETYNKVCTENDDVTIIAFSDHGHIDIEEPKIDINDYFKMENENVNKYIHLIESNYARFWFRNDREKEKVLRIIQRMERDNLGFILDEKYKEKYHLRMNPKEHGDVVFYLAAPHEFTKTIWGFGKSVKSGHGFEPVLKKHHGIFCSNKRLACDREFAYLTDVLPSIMKQLNISREGYLLRGKNIVDTDKSD